MELASIAIATLSSVILVCLLYRWVFVIGYLARGDRLTSGAPATRFYKFAVIIPAHNEATVIAASVKSLRSTEYPGGHVDIIVVADNCDDTTALEAAAAGAIVHERVDQSRFGKGQALQWILSRIDLRLVDAVVFVDADCLVSPNFFSAASRELDAGWRVLQGYDGISNPGESPLTRLMAVTNVMKNLLYQAGKSALGFSPVLMGTGMVFKSEVLARLGWKAESVGEDLEQTFPLLRSGERVRFVPDARVYAQEAASFGQALRQRRRWATGRSSLAPIGRRALIDGIKSRDPVLAEAGLGILLPTYSMLMNWTVILLIAVAVACPVNSPLLALSASLVLLQLAEFALGLWLMRADRRFVASVVIAPLFLLWKGCVDLLTVIGSRQRVWVRTDRHREL